MLTLILRRYLTSFTLPELSIHFAYKDRYMVNCADFPGVTTPDLLKAIERLVFPGHGD